MNNQTKVKLRALHRVLVNEGQFTAARYLLSVLRRIPATETAALDNAVLQAHGREVAR